MRISITAKGPVSVNPWSNDVKVNGRSLPEQIAEAVRSIECSSDPFATVTVELLVQEPIELATSIDGIALGSEKTVSEEEETE